MKSNFDPPLECTDAPIKFKWDHTSIKMFKDFLHSDTIRGEFEKYQSEHAACFSQNIIESNTQTLIKCAESCGIKKQKNHCKVKNTQTWFDQECKKARKKLMKLAKLLKHAPENNVLRDDLFCTKRSLKSMIRRKKTEYKANIMDKIHLTKRKDIRQFWKLVGMLNTRGVQNDTSGYISVDKWVKHFNGLLHAEVKRPFPVNKANGPLDYSITEIELLNAVKSLKPGKSPGLDNITNEMLSAAISVYPLAFLKLFNHILSAGGRETKSWAVSILVPIHKKGSPDDPSNYRGISLLSCLAKLFYKILNNRLLDYAIANHILTPNQLGFLPGNRTSDAHIILNNLINKYCHKRGKYIFGCFVDFSKAFDSVPRATLFEKLIKHGITGKFLDVIMNAYTNDFTYIKLKNKLSPKIISEIGVKQGCILSPLLFNIFMSDLTRDLGTDTGVLIDDNMNLSCLIWADDILLLSESEEDLQRSLNVLFEFCKQNEISINADKTKCMIFNKTGRLIRRDFFVGKEKLENVREYKYLGLLCTPSGEIKSALEDLRSRALKAYWNLKLKLGKFFNQEILETIHLFDSLVKPILTYASDFWGCLKLPKNNPIENVHMMFCKHLLGVSKQTSNSGVLLELGRIPITISAKKAAIKNWERIRKGMANSYLNLSFKHAKKNSLNWITSVDKTLTDIGLGYLSREGTERNILRILEQRLIDIYHQDAFGSMKNSNSKLRTYSSIKTKIGIENYLLNIKNLDYRKSLTQLRLSNHKLMIEIGRHQKIAALNRLCTFCKNEVEDEVHFVVKCKTFSHLREEILEKCIRSSMNFDYYTDKEKFIFILTNEQLETSVAKFCFLANELRTSLLESP